MRTPTHSLTMLAVTLPLSILVALSSARAATADTTVAASTAATAAAASTPAVAAMSTPARSVAEQIASLQAQNAVLDWQARNAKLQADIRKAQQDGTAAIAAATGPAPSTPLSGASLPALPVSRNGDIQVQSITAFDGRYRALIDLNGRTYDAASGDKLDGGWAVTGITETAVQLTRGKHSRTVTW